MQVGRRKLCQQGWTVDKNRGPALTVETERMRMSCPDNQYKTAQKPKTPMSPQSSYIMTEVFIL